MRDRGTAECGPLEVCCRAARASRQLLACRGRTQRGDGRGERVRIAGWHEQAVCHIPFLLQPRIDGTEH